MSTLNVFSFEKYRLRTERHTVDRQHFIHGHKVIDNKQQQRYLMR